MDKKLEQLEVITLNIWGLWLASKHRWERVRRLGVYLQQTTADVVLLQEVWVTGDAEYLIECSNRAGLSYAVHFKSGMFGSGLVTLSRYPIVEENFWKYSTAGDPSAIFCGDYYASKGIGWVRVKTKVGYVDVFNTHLHANYSHKYSSKHGSASSSVEEFRIPEDPFAPYRVAQMLELSNMIRLVSQRGIVGVLLGGDLNAKPGTLELQILRTLLPELRDAWGHLHPDDPGYTCKAPGNTYQPKRQVQERIDYVLSTLRPQSCEITLKHGPEGTSYSDHFAVRAHLALPDPTACPADTAAPLLSWSLGTQSLSKTQAKLLTAAQNILKDGQSRTERQSRGKFLLSWASMGALLLLLLASACGHDLNELMAICVAVIITCGVILPAFMASLGDIAQRRALQQCEHQLSMTLLATKL